MIKIVASALSSGDLPLEAFHTGWMQLPGLSKDIAFIVPPTRKTGR